jgi:hypothetical protein
VCFLSFITLCFIFLPTCQNFIVYFHNRIPPPPATTCSQQAVLYTVEFQKRGLPHEHIIFWVPTDTSEPNLEFIESFISVEIPDPSVDPLGYSMIAEHMVHGPCGKHNPMSSCIKLDNCWIVPHNLELLKKYDAYINT